MGFYKTKPLAPGESEDKTVRFAVSAMASYHEGRSAWLLEEGRYGIFVGNSLDSSVFCASVLMDGEAVLMETEHICPLQDTLDEIKADAGELNVRRNAWLKEAGDRPEITVHNFDIVKREVCYERNFRDFPDEVAAFVDRLTTDQLIELVTGDISKAQGCSIGAAGNSVPGSAAQTSGCAEGLASIVLADGPAGLRLNKTYQAVDGKPISMPFEMAIEDGFFARGEMEKKGETYYQYCTELGYRDRKSVRQGSRTGNGRVWRHTLAGSRHEHSPESAVRQEFRVLLRRSAALGCHRGGDDGRRTVPGRVWHDDQTLCMQQSGGQPDALEQHRVGTRAARDLSQRV